MEANSNSFPWGSGSGVFACRGASLRGGDQQLWHQTLGHLNYGDMDSLKGDVYRHELYKGEENGDVCGMLQGQNACENLSNA